MSSSVSSERAFSQGGITITKHRNRLKGDIVEALQCAKCAIRHDLLFREPGPSSVIEAALKDNNDDAESGNGEGEGEEDFDGDVFEDDTVDEGLDEFFIGDFDDGDVEPAGMNSEPDSD
jgi:hypothetical protein